VNWGRIILVLKYIHRNPTLKQRIVAKVDCEQKHSFSVVVTGLVSKPE